MSVSTQGVPAALGVGDLTDVSLPCAQEGSVAAA